MVATTSPTPSLPWGERWKSVGKGEKKVGGRERERKDKGELGGREGWRKKVGRRGVGEFEGEKRKEGYRRVRRERRIKEGER